MPYDVLSLLVVDRIATLTVNRPEKLNALNEQTIAELGIAIDELRGRDDVGGIILTGAGRAFIAGADIAELQRHGPDSAHALSRRGQETFGRFASSQKPVIAAVNGFALGGGCELAMACHLRIASETAKFGQPEVKLGLIPGYGGTQRLPRLVGMGRALQLLLTGEIIDADEAFRIGLVNRVVPSDQLATTTHTIMRQILANAPLALAQCVEVVQGGTDIPLADGLVLEARAFARLTGTEDKREGTKAFLEKRPAAFTGS